jgi:hypothetical protein
MLKIFPGINASNFPALFGPAPLDIAKRAFPPSQWIHVRLALVEGLDGFNDLLLG